MQNTLDRNKSRSDGAEDQLSNQEDKVAENSQLEQQKEKKIENK